MDSLIKQIKQDFPAFILRQGDRFYWSSGTKEIVYPKDGDPASLLHELGHALLSHTRFTNDLDLLAKEVAAWQKAKELTIRYNVPITEQCIDHCLDTYRDWLYCRSACPRCSGHGLQAAERLYKCLNCAETWNVTKSVQCRPYRLRTGALKAK